MKVYIFVLYIYAMKNKYYREGINRLIFYCMIFNIVICLAAIKIPMVFRMREYFSLADFIGVSVILKEAMRQKDISCVLIIAFSIIYIALLTISFDNFINSSNMNNRYQFFFN